MIHGTRLVTGTLLSQIGRSNQNHDAEFRFTRSNLRTRPWDHAVFSSVWGHSKCGASHNPFILIHQFNRSPRFDVKTKTPTPPQTNNISTTTVIFSNYLYHYVIMYLILKQQ